MHRRVYKEVGWDEVKDQVKLYNSSIHAAIEKASPKSDFKLFSARFLFGDLIIDRGILNFPIANELLSIADPNFPAAVKKELGYSRIPLCLILNKSAEVFVATSDRAIPLDIFKPGNILGLFETLDAFFNVSANPIWSVSAGARNLFMLPKISEASGLKKLRSQFNLPSNMNLTKLEEHWQTFAAIANSPQLNTDWCCEVLFFTKQWLSQKGNPVWHSFYEEIYKQTWTQAQFAMSKMVIDLSWQYFADAIATRRLKPSPYIVDQVKHLLAIAVGVYPAFRPAKNEDAAPIKCIQAAFVNIYNLKKHIPTIMHIVETTTDRTTPVYYSLYNATLLSGTPKKQIFSTIMLDLRDIKLLLDTIQDTIKKQKIFKNNIFEQINFEYFHVEHDIYNEIQPSKIIGDDDPNFLSGLNNFPDREFCSTSPFWRGCIRLNT